jgi:hypothetical protein
VILKSTCNFIAYSKIIKIIKKIGIKCEGKKNGRDCSEILHGWHKFHEDREGKKKCSSSPN